MVILTSHTRLIVWTWDHYPRIHQRCKPTFIYRHVLHVSLLLGSWNDVGLLRLCCTPWRHVSKFVAPEAPHAFLFLRTRNTWVIVTAAIGAPFGITVRLPRLLPYCWSFRFIVLAFPKFCFRLHVTFHRFILLEAFLQLLHIPGPV